MQASTFVALQAHIMFPSIGQQHAQNSIQMLTIPTLLESMEAKRQEQTTAARHNVSHEKPHGKRYTFQPTSMILPYGLC